MVGVGIGLGTSHSTITEPLALLGSSTLKVWLSPESITQSANVITAWKDRSGNANDTTPTNSPAFTASAIDSFGCATLTAGSSQHFLLPNVFTGLTSAEIFFVVKSTTTGVTAGLHNFGNSTGTQELFPWSDGHIYENFATNTRQDTGSAIISLSSAFRLYNVRSSSTGFSNWLNLSQQFTTGTNTVAWSTHPAVGGSAGSGGVPSTFFTGSIAEVILTSVVLTSGQRTQIHRYIKTKYPSLSLVM